MSKRLGNSSKLQRALMTQKKRTERRVADALAKYLKVQNPGQKVTSAKIQRLKGGVIKITPLKSNPAPDEYGDRYAGYTKDSQFGGTDWNYAGGFKTRKDALEWLAFMHANGWKAREVRIRPS
jgi:hypothetical protein